MLGLIEVKKGKLESAEGLAAKMEENLTSTGSHRLKELYHHLKGRIFLAQNRYDLSIGEFKQALNIGPLDHAFFGNALAEAYYRNEDFDMPIEIISKVLEFNPNHAPSHFLLGQVYEKRKEIKKAIKEYGRFLEIWKNGDEQMPLLVEGRRKMTRLRNFL